jgi:hypothetical protein
MKPGLYVLRRDVENPQGDCRKSGWQYDKLWPAGAVFKVLHHPGAVWPCIHPLGDPYCFVLSVVEGSLVADHLVPYLEPTGAATAAQVVADNNITEKHLLAALVASGEVSLETLDRIARWGTDIFYDPVECEIIYDQFKIQPGTFYRIGEPHE